MDGQKQETFKMRITITILATLLFVTLTSFAFAESAGDPFTVPEDVQSVVAKRCIDCHGADASEGDVRFSWGTEAPFVIMAGDNCKLDIAGRYIRLPYHGPEGHKTLGNWYTTLLNAHGNPIEHYGDLDLEMSRKKLEQTGPIKQFVGRSN